jgi:hypothetical protein
VADDKSSRLPVAARRTGHRGGTVNVRPLNCGTGETEGGRRCPRCKQFHLRPGYCQALDPINADQYPEFHATVSPKNAVSPPAGDRGKSVTSSNNNELENRVPDNPGDVTDNVPDRECAVCGVTFIPRRSDAKYCSPGCRKKASRQAGAEAGDDT